MCMRNVNAVVNLFASVRTNDEYISFSVPFDTIKCMIKNNTAYISDFFIVANMNLMGTTREDSKKDNVVETCGKLKCLLRLTKISKNPDERFSWDIEEFCIDTSDKRIRFEDACVPTVNTRKIVEVQDIELTENYRGDYALKLLVRIKDEDAWQVQSITRLTVI